MDPCVIDTPRVIALSLAALGIYLLHSRAELHRASRATEAAEANYRATVLPE